MLLTPILQRRRKRHDEACSRFGRYRFGRHRFEWRCWRCRTETRNEFRSDYCGRQRQRKRDRDSLQNFGRPAGQQLMLEHLEVSDSEKHHHRGSHNRRPPVLQKKSGDDEDDR